MRPEVAQQLLDGLVSSGVDFVAALPEKNLEPLVARIRTDERILHVPLAREEEGLGICVGAYLGGKTPCLVMMNAGYLTCINAITLVAQYSQIPVLLLIGNNGGFGEQFLMHTPLARVTEPVLEATGIPFRCLSDPRQIRDDFHRAVALARSSRLPVAVVLDGECLRD